MEIIMGHGIEKTDKGIVARVQAWHGLWTLVSDFLTAGEALIAAGLDWTVAAVSAFAVNPTTGDMVEVPEVKLTQRTDTGAIFGAVTTGYQTIQNHTLSDAISAIFGIGAKVVEAAFSLFGGRKVVMLVNMGAAKIELALQGKIVEDSHVSYLMFSTSHDGKGGWSILPTAVRTICANTVRAAEGENGEVLSRDGITIRHSAKSEDRIADAVKAYQQAIEAGRLNLNRIQRIASKRITATAKRAFYRAVVDNTLAPATADQIKAAQTDPDKAKLIAAREAKREALYTSFLAWEAVEASSFTPGATETDNAYLAFNAVSDAMEHESHFRKSDGATREENEFVSRTYGKVADQKEEALLLLEKVISDSSNLLASVVEVGVRSTLDSMLQEDGRSTLDLILAEA
jgi:phage/plasmid-like protein (TIGR03299 family)